MSDERTAGYKLCQLVSNLAAKCYGLRVEGLQNVPSTGPALLVSNHQSYLDVSFIGGTVKRHVVFVARKQVAAPLFMRPIIRTTQAILLDQKASRSALLEAIGRLAAGSLVAIFPEGTRRPQLGTFERGIELIFHRIAVPIVPIGISGAHDAWPIGQRPRWRAPKPITIQFGSPIRYAQSDDSRELLARVRQAVNDLIQT